MSHNMSFSGPMLKTDQREKKGGRGGRKRKGKGDICTYRVHNLSFSRPMSGKRSMRAMDTLLLW
jgi:hypothetical protein